MSETFNHKCIKCQSEYTDTDPEPYYCAPCNETRLAIAKEIDRKLANRPKKEIKSDFQMYEEIRKSKGTPFVNIKDLI